MGPKRCVGVGQVKGPGQKRHVFPRLTPPPQRFLSQQKTQPVSADPVILAQTLREVVIWNRKKGKGKKKEKRQEGNGLIKEMGSEQGSGVKPHLQGHLLL